MWQPSSLPTPLPQLCSVFAALLLELQPKGSTLALVAVLGPRSQLQPSSLRRGPAEHAPLGATCPSVPESQSEPVAVALGRTEGLHRLQTQPAAARCALFKGAF